MDMKNLFDELEQDLMMKEFIEEDIKLEKTVTVRLDKFTVKTLEEISEKYHEPVAGLLRKVISMMTNYYLGKKMEEKKSE